MTNINIFVKPYIICIKKVFYIMLLLIIFELFSISSLIGFTLTCGKHFCYYDNCYKHTFDKKIKCFFDKTNNFSDWLILDFTSLGIICGTILILILLRKAFIKIKKYFTDCSKYKFIILSNNHNNRKKKYAPRSEPFEPLEKIEEIEEIEELEELEEIEANVYEEEQDPLLMV